MSEKLQKVLARAGVGSRREMETVISEGRVSVNGKIATLGDRVDASAAIRVDGHQITVPSVTDVICRVLAYHKPEGEVCTRHDPEGRPTVFDRLLRISRAAAGAQEPSSIRPTRRFRNPFVRKCSKNSLMGGNSPPS
jgi:23S rRNA pseudouridine2605 synthase